jgi:hypothetical protein
MSGYVLNVCSECTEGPSAPQHRDQGYTGAHRFRSPLMTRAELHAREVGVNFDEACHEYTLPVVDVTGHKEGRGVKVPSVTQVLKAENFVDYTFCNEFARERGSRAHEAIHYLCENDLQRESVDPQIDGYVTSAEAFLNDLHVEIVMAEAIVYSALYGYAGKADLFGYLRRRHALASIDWKTGAPPPATALQLAGYAGAWQEMTGETVVERIAVQLTPGGPKPYRLTEYRDRGDLGAFRGAVASHNWKRRYLNVRAA